MMHAQNLRMRQSTDRNSFFTKRINHFSSSKALLHNFYSDATIDAQIRTLIYDTHTARADKVNAKMANHLSIQN